MIRLGGMKGEGEKLIVVFVFMKAFKKLLPLS
jgi:hypothetical protein